MDGRGIGGGVGGNGDDRDEICVPSGRVAFLEREVVPKIYCTSDHQHGKQFPWDIISIS